MSFPEQFSSTAIYENRYDLDEIDVFLEGDSSNPMFFNIEGLPKQLSYGKHYFNLTILDSTNQQYQLRPNSQILFEFKSINGVVIKSDVSNLNQRNGVITAFVEVLKDPLISREEIEDGEGKLTIVGSLQDKSNTQNTTNLLTRRGEFINRRTGDSIDSDVSYHLHEGQAMEGAEHNSDIQGGTKGHDFYDRVGSNQTMTTNSIPEKFKGVMNYRCTFPINIRKNLINADSPSITNSTHTLKTIPGRFPFVKVNVSPPDTVDDVGFTYDENGSPQFDGTPIGERDGTD
jgi:hypothetical protein